MGLLNIFSKKPNKELHNETIKRLLWLDSEIQKLIDSPEMNSDHTDPDDVFELINLMEHNENFIIACIAAYDYYGYGQAEDFIRDEEKLDEYKIDKEDIEDILETVAPYLEEGACSFLPGCEDGYSPYTKLDNSFPYTKNLRLILNPLIKKFKINDLDF